MKKTLKFILISLWIVATRAYDIQATHQFTPDLTKEANPLASVLGLDWTPIILIIAGLTAYTIYAYYIATFRSFDFSPKDKGLSFAEFIPYVFLGKKSHWSAMFYKLPDSWQRFNHYMGHYLTACLVFAGVISTLMWLGINYTEFYPPLHNVVALYSIIVGGCLVIGYFWNRRLYLKYIGDLDNTGRSDLFTIN